MLFSRLQERSSHTMTTNRLMNDKRGNKGPFPGYMNRRMDMQCKYTTDTAITISKQNGVPISCTSLCNSGCNFSGRASIA